MAVRDRGATPFAAPGASAQARHLGRGPSLVDEHQPTGIEIRLPLEPGPATRCDVRPVLLGGVARCFLKLNPWRSKKRHTVPIPTATPRSHSRACSSARVMSGVRATWSSRKLAWASIRPERRSPPWGLARASPCSCHD